MKNLILFLQTSSFILASVAFGAERPNILYLYVDDLGWGSIGPNGQAERKAEGKPYVLTPYLDRLAEQGINFTRGYGCTVCSPARSSQQTGFHQGYTFADRNDPDNAKKAIRKDDITMGDALAQAGYTTGYWGKWGYGGSRDMQNPTIDNVQTLPTSHGYKFVVAELHHVRAHTFFQPTLWNAPSKRRLAGGLELKANSMVKYRNQKSYSNYPASQNHPDYPKVAYCDDVYAFACLDFVREQAAEYNRSGKPFFGLFAAQIPHAPFAEVQKLPNWDHDYKDKSFFKKLSPQSQQWCAMVTRIDAHFGNILKALEDPNGDGDKSDSVADNTLVVFQSDNGGPGGSNREQLDANGGLQGSKGSIYEGGIRVPTIMRWSEKITQKSKLKKGSSSDWAMDCSDLLPTFCELAGVPIPLGVSGVSLAPTLTGKGIQRPRDFLIHEAGNQASIIDGQYKLIRPRGDTKSSASSKKKKRKKEPVTMLFDLNTDPAEQNNLAEVRPQLVKKLNALLTAERVDEPAGFANTYHTWNAKTKNGSLGSSSNWSEYIYENAEIVYIKDAGVPKSHWCAQIQKGTAVALKETNFLGLEVAGVLVVKKGAKVNARNELRVSDAGQVNLQGGTIGTHRWIEIEKGGVLKGHGIIKGDLYNQGTISLQMDKPLQVDGSVNLSGKLDILKTGGINNGESYTVLQANSISGGFVNDEVSIGGEIFSVFYTPTSVTVKAKQ
ncbi:MAG: sulfatase-like hydrolase/transferase [Opitutae bacterium]|nr:sulfatase-like hydrolase/transferase [Opitutae bacterium]